MKATLRSCLAVLPKLGLVKKPNFHKEGITFIIAVKDEEQWIKPCILSIEPVADEIIIVDSSIQDNTTNIIESLAKKCDKIKHIQFYCENVHAFALSLHIGLVNANYKWVFKWDGDFVAKSPEALMEWKDRLGRLDKKEYFVINLPRVNFEGDLKHQPKNCPFGIYEARLFTWSPELKWALKNNYWEQVCGDSVWGHRFPPWYRILRWREPYIFHCNIKNPKRMLMRMFLADYFIAKDPRFPSLLDYTIYRVKNDWHMSLSDAQNKIMNDNQKNLIPYGNDKYGELPVFLKNLME
ncbi:MAG: glycosyltransferase [Candidatus Bathyarchaeia archaeon]|jgi:glycosyltransferase involved in cell wall biosynthesis